MENRKDNIWAKTNARATIYEMHDDNFGGVSDHGRFEKEQIIKAAFDNKGFDHSTQRKMAEETIVSVPATKFTENLNEYRDGTMAESVIETEIICKNIDDKDKSNLILSDIVSQFCELQCNDDIIKLFVEELVRRPEMFKFIKKACGYTDNRINDSWRCCRERWLRELENKAEEIKQGLPKFLQFGKDGFKHKLPKIDKLGLKYVARVNGNGNQWIKDGVTTVLRCEIIDNELSISGKILSSGIELQLIDVAVDEELVRNNVFYNLENIGCKDEALDWMQSMANEIFKNIVCVSRVRPEDMWVEKEPEDKTIYCKDHCDIQDFLVASDCIVFGGSVRGRSHAHEGKYRDDDFRIVVQPNVEKDPWLCLVVADGAGSAIYSREGSRIACEVVSRRVFDVLSKYGDIEQACRDYVTNPNQQTEQNARAALGRLFIKLNGDPGIALEAKYCIEYEAKKKQAEKREYSTTFLCAVVKKFDEGWFFGTFWVGDGAILLKTANELVPLGEPDEGEYGGQTRFLTMDSGVWDVGINSIIDRRIVVHAAKDFEALALMTDGISDPIFETKSGLKNIENWNKLFDNTSEFKSDFSLRQVIEQAKNDNKADVVLGKKSEHVEYRRSLEDRLKFYSRSNHDDRTLVVVYKGANNE